MMLPPLASIVRSTLGWLLCWSKPGCASVRFSPVTSTCFLTITGRPARSKNFSEPKGTGPPLSSAARPSDDSSTRRISRVAVRPRISLALAVSCTPGSCTTMRSMPCCWITGSATPSSLIRLCSVVMFCLSAASCRRRAASGLMVATRRQLLPSGPSVVVRSGNWSWISCLAFSSAAASRKVTSTAWPLRLTWVPRMSFERKLVRRSLAKDSAFLSMAPFMSTCSRKSTPPRRSSPRYIGKACSAVSHLGERDTRFSATV